MDPMKTPPPESSLTTKGAKRKHRRLERLQALRSELPGLHEDKRRIKQGLLKRGFTLLGFVCLFPVLLACGLLIRETGPVYWGLKKMYLAWYGVVDNTKVMLDTKQRIEQTKAIAEAYGVRNDGLALVDVPKPPEGSVSSNTEPAHLDQA